MGQAALGIELRIATYVKFEDGTVLATLGKNNTMIYSRNLQSPDRHFVS